MTLYLVRHAQSAPRKDQPCSDWPLSPTGIRQAKQLSELLVPLAISHIFSSPFTRSLQTAQPFAAKTGIQIEVVDDLRERLVAPPGELPSDDEWRRSWEDFNACLPGCETSLKAQARIHGAICQIARTASATSAAFTHGNVIGLFLNAITSSAGRMQAEGLTNPDVLKIECSGGTFTWHPTFRLPGLEHIITEHAKTPKATET
jgi:2,3-bisphosphoglycerate-dependent phosphoglycerate mutase